MVDQLPEADELFECPPDRFTAARNALVKRLKSEGDGEAAGRVAALRRPTPTVWALNQLARRQGGLVAEVLAAGERLRGATEQAMNGDRSGFQLAQAGERESIRRAVSAALELLAGVGVKATEAARLRMTETLRAATVDPGVSDRLTRGVLEADASAPGLGLDGLSEPSMPPTPRQEHRDERRAEPTSERDVRIQKLEAAVGEARAQVESAEAAIEDASARLSELRELAVAARRDLRRAEKDLSLERAKR